MSGFRQGGDRVGWRVCLQEVRQPFYGACSSGVAVLQGMTAGVVEPVARLAGWAVQPSGETLLGRVAVLARRVSFPLFSGHLP